MTVKGAVRARVASATGSLATLLFCFYGITGPGHSSLADGFVSFLTARSVYYDGTLTIAELPAGGVRPGIDGRTYSVYGPAAALVMIPALVASGWVPMKLQPRVAGAEVETLRRDEFWVSLTNAALMAAVVAFVFRAGIELGSSPRAALGVALSVAVASPLWSYARIDGSEALQALGLIGAFSYLARARRRVRDRRLLAAAGTFAAVAFAAKVVNLVCLPWLALITLRRGDDRREASQKLLTFFFPVIIVGVLVALYDQARFGAPWSTGYSVGLRFFSHSILDSAIRLLFFPSYGLLAFWPGFALAIVGAWPFARRFRREAIVIAGISVSLLLIHASTEIWWGACWGPRYLVPAVPLLALFVMSIATGRAAAITLVAVTLLGIAVQLVAVGSSYRHQVMATWWEIRSPSPLALHTDPAVAPLAIGSWWLRQEIATRRGADADAREILLRPPWIEKFPWWRRGTEGADRLEALRGLDVWALPRAWKMPRYDYWRQPEDASPIPSDPPLAALLVVTGAAAAGFLLRFAVLVDDRP